MDSEKDHSGGGDFDDNVKVNHQEVCFLSYFLSYFLSDFLSVYFKPKGVTC